MKKLLFATLMSLTLGSLGASVPCFNEQQCNTDCEVPCYSPCAPTYSNTCTTDPACCNSWNGVSVDVDFLWWTTSVENTGVSFSDINLLATPTAITSTTYDIKYKWKPGYRIELGYESCICGYNVDLFARWTWFRTTASRDLAGTNITGHTLTIVDPFISGFVVTPTTVAYSNSSSFLFEHLDLGLMTDCFRVGYFTFKPSAAVTFAYIEDTFHSTVVVGTGTPIATSNKGKFNGGGITIGAHASYPLLENLFMFSISEFTGLWGKIDIHTNATGVNTNSPGIISTQTDFWAGRIILSQQFGIAYGTCIYSFPVSAHLGWEFLYLPNMSMALNPQTTQQDRTINGLVAGIAVGF